MPLKNLLLHLHNSYYAAKLFLWTPLPLISRPFLPLFSLFSFAYLTEATAMPADLCSAGMSAKLLRYAVILIEQLLSACITQSQKTVQCHQQTCLLFSTHSTYTCGNGSAQWQQTRVLTVLDAEIVLLEQQQKKQQRMFITVQNKYLIKSIPILCVYLMR